MREKRDGFMSRAGFFVTMAVCLTVAGISGYFLLAGREEPAPETAPPFTEETVTELPETDPQPAAPVRPVAGVPVIDVLEPQPVETPAPMPEAEVDSAPAAKIDPAPVAPEQPRLTVAPLEGDVLTAFSMDALVFSETLEDWRTHNGVDIAAPVGTAVLSACAGTVVAVENDVLMGTTVSVLHHDGYQTTYANLEMNPPVLAGDEVSAGEVIGTVGETAAAEAAQPPHLHFSVTQDGEIVDPDTFLRQ